MGQLCPNWTQMEPWMVSIRRLELNSQQPRSSGVVGPTPGSEANPSLSVAITKKPTVLGPTHKVRRLHALSARFRSESSSPRAQRTVGRRCRAARWCSAWGRWVCLRAPSPPPSRPGTHGKRDGRLVVLKGAPFLGWRLKGRQKETERPGWGPPNILRDRHIWKDNQGAYPRFWSCSPDANGQ